MRTARKVRTLSHLVTVRALAATSLAASLVIVGCGDASTGTNTFWHGGAGGAGVGSPGATPPSGSGSGSATPPANPGSGTGTSVGTGPDGTGTGPGTGSSTGSGSGTSAPTPPPSLSVTPDDTAPKVDLLSTTSLNVAIPGSTYAGTLALTVTGLPSDVTATFDNPTVTLSPAGSTAKLTLATLSSTASGSVPFDIVATVGTGQPTSAPVTLTVNPVITINIPVNVDAMQGSTSNPNKMAFGDYPIRIKAPANFPVTVNFHNLDSTPHEIHAEQQQQGFPHGNGLIQQGQDDMPRNVTQSGTYDWHLHDEGDATTVGEIVIQ
jgi:hypothetical protein